MRTLEIDVHLHIQFMLNLDNQIQFSKAPPKRLVTEINDILGFKSDTQRYDTDVHIEHEDILKRYTYM